MIANTTTQTSLSFCSLSSSHSSEREHPLLLFAHEEMSIMLHLLQHGQSLCQASHTATESLCEHLLRLTEEKAYLLLHHKPTAQTLPPGTQLSIPVCFKARTYGTLCIIGDTPGKLALSFPFAQLLAQICSWVLYTLEQAVFLERQCQQLDYFIHGPLTQREKDVLFLICQGYDTKDIAATLCISPTTVNKHRQHIYEQLGVHSEHDAALVAYQSGIFTPLDL